MDTCEWWFLLYIFDLWTLCYWLLFFLLWVWRLYTVHHTRLHWAVAATVLSRLIQKVVAIPALRQCKPNFTFDTLAYVTGEVNWVVIFTLGVVICRGYGITHWKFRGQTLVKVILACSPMVLLTIIPIGLGNNNYKAVADGYYLLVYTYQLHIGYKTLNTLKAIASFISDIGEVTQVTPVREKQKLMTAILAILGLVYGFSVIVFTLVVVNLTLGDRAIAHLSEIRDVVMIAMEPLLNTVIYFQVRPKAQDLDLIYCVDPERPFQFQRPEEEPLATGLQIVINPNQYPV